METEKTKKAPLGNEEESRKSSEQKNREDDEKMIEYSDDVVKLEDEETKGEVRNSDTDDFIPGGKDNSLGNNDDNDSSENESIEGAMNNPAIPNQTVRVMEYTSAGVPFQREEGYHFKTE